MSVVCGQIPGEDSIARARGIVDKFLAMGLGKVQEGAGDSGAADMRVALALLANIVRGADVLFPAREADAQDREASQVRPAAVCNGNVHSRYWLRVNNMRSLTVKPDLDVWCLEGDDNTRPFLFHMYDCWCMRQV